MSTFGDIIAFDVLQVVGSLSRRRRSRGGHYNADLSFYAVICVVTQIYTPAHTLHQDQFHV